MSAVRHAQTAAKILFDSDYSSINVSDLLSALESDPKLVYVDKGEMFSVPLIKVGASTALFGSVCEFPSPIRCARLHSQQRSLSGGKKSGKIQRFEIEQYSDQGSVICPEA